MSVDLTAPAAPTVSHTPSHDTEAPTTRILGLCPKCEDWFDCDTWFDRSLPTPCCPSCGLGPAAIRYSRYESADGPHVTSELWLG